MIRRNSALALVVALAACGDDGDDQGRAAATRAPTVLPTTAPSSTPATAERIVPVNGDLAEVVYALRLGRRAPAASGVGTDPARKAVDAFSPVVVDQVRA